ncbi:hypothetical protein QJS04_geneDACA012477 [Acorus gramineus]|uniref:serine C-palmitoyltransferase n=1 Tax=Acorus gramineus TaxID=55184 RepID=A0AAV9BCM5_ACOGR|nr:hypothetical protein QJS04_geneDACA012477 [Acorus gramineus]
MEVDSWDQWLEAALDKLTSMNLVRSVRPILLETSSDPSDQTKGKIFVDEDEHETFDELRSWDRSSVEICIDESTLHNWLHDVPSLGDEIMRPDRKAGGRKLLLFSGNDYLGLSCHPTVRKAAAMVAQEHGMGPRGSALICGYTNYHRRLESALAELKKKEDCLLCPTGFAANMALIVTLGSVSSLISTRVTHHKYDKIAIFSDALNHASIIDGIRLAERRQEAKVFIYKHCDMAHLDVQLSRCPMEKKVVITDSVFSMDGDFAPIVELAELRKKHKFLLVIDDAHATLVFGKNGGGLAEEYGCEDDVDVCIGTLSKAAGCQGGFIACSKKWKQLIQSRGRSFIFSTALPVPIAAAAHASLIVSKKEQWRRRTIWDRVHDFRAFTGIAITSYIIAIVVGSEASALRASRHLLRSGFHVTAIRPPTVPSNLCRLRITLTAAHTTEDIKKLAAALSCCIKLDVNGSAFDVIDSKL